MKIPIVKKIVFAIITLLIGVLWFVLGANHQSGAKSFPHQANYLNEDIVVKSSYASVATPLGIVNFIAEASGIAESKINKDALWVHNDGGCDSEIFLISALDGDILAVYDLKSVKNRDWEDMAVAWGKNDLSTVRQEQKSFVYLGDIGDNIGFRDEIIIYRFEEPLFKPEVAKKRRKIKTEIEKIVLVYPDGPKDAETLLVDPFSNDVIVITKREYHVSMYKASIPSNPKRELILTKVGELPFNGVVSGDVAENGDVILKTYTEIFFWKNKNKKEVWKLLAEKPTKLYYSPAEPQGEAICFGRNGYFTLSENAEFQPPVLYYYPPNN
ncbi:hypothetical protein OAA06_01435 [bacterium]|nr:hypothetical protein [bacterium]